MLPLDAEELLHHWSVLSAVAGQEIAVQVAREAAKCTTSGPLAASVTLLDTAARRFMITLP